MSAGLAVNTLWENATPPPLSGRVSRPELEALRTLCTKQGVSQRGVCPSLSKKALVFLSKKALPRILRLGHEQKHGEGA